VTWSRVRKVLRWTLAVWLGLIILFVAAIVIAERLLDSPKVRTDLTAKLSALVQGKVTWDALEVRVLPVPHAVLRNAYLSIPDVVTVSVAETDVTLRWLPLLRGSVELDAVIVRSPNVDIWIAKSAAPEAQKTDKNPLEAYRSAMRPVLDIVSRFAPDTTLAIDEGRVALHILQLPPFEAANIDLNIVTDAKGITVDATATGAYWERVALDGRIEFADTRALVKMDVAGLKAQPILEGVLADIRQALVLSSIGAKLEARTDGLTGINVSLDLDLPRAELQRLEKKFNVVEIRLGGSIKFAEDDIEIGLDKIHLGELLPAGRLNLNLLGTTHAPQLDVAIDELNLTRLREAALALAGDQPVVQEYIARISGGQLTDLKLTSQADSFAELFSLPRLHGRLQIAGGAMLVPTLELEATEIAARVELKDSAISVSDTSGRIGASRIRQAGTKIVLVEPMRLEATHGAATLVLHDLLPGLRLHEPLSQVLRAVPPMTGIAAVTIRDLALRFDRPNKVSYDLTVKPQRVRAQTNELPEPISVDGGNVRVTSRSIRADRVGIEVLKSRATVSVEVTDFQNGQPLVKASVADGVVGREAIDWIWRRAAIPPKLAPATPLRFSARQINWREGGLDIAAEAQFDKGPSIGVDFSTQGKTFTLRRATVKDSDSDAIISFAAHESSMEFDFTGKLATRTVAAMLAGTQQEFAGRVAGAIHLTFDSQRPQRTVVRGKLTGERINLANALPMPLQLERFDLEGDGTVLHIRELSADWAGQKATLRGDVTRQNDEFAIKAELDTSGIVIDALLNAPSKPTAGPPTTRPTAADAPSADRTAVNRDTSSGLWSLPIKGTLAMRAGYVEYKRRRVENIQAVAALENDAAALNVSEAFLCGIGIPLSIRVVPKEFDATMRLAAKNTSLDNLATCLGNEHFSITGNFDINAALSAKGAMDNIGQSIVRNASGTIEVAARDGQIRKLALLGNIMAMKSVSDLAKGDVKFGSDGFAYRKLDVLGKIASGKFTLEAASLDSPGLGLAATGTISLENYDSHLTALVAPFGTLDRVARKIPIVGYVMGGALTSIPVGVSGDIRDPRVVPLGPRAVGSEVFGIFERTFKLPGKLVDTLTPKHSEAATP